MIIFSWAPCDLTFLILRDLHGEREGIAWLTKHLDWKEIDSTLAMVDASCLSFVNTFSLNNYSIYLDRAPLTLLSDFLIWLVKANQTHEKVSRDLKNSSKTLWSAKRYAVQFLLAVVACDILATALASSESNLTNLLVSRQSGARATGTLVLYVAWSSCKGKNSILKALLESFSKLFCKSCESDNKILKS